MRIPPTYTLTAKLSQLLASIEASREVIDTIAVPIEVEANLRRQSTLRSSLFSARIEGNPLTIDDMQVRSTKDQRKIEVFNILRAINAIQGKQSNKVTIKDILALHEIVMNGLTSELGRFRSEVSAIFNSAGIAIYMPPPPTHIPSLIEKLLTFMNNADEPLVPIRACLAHYSFEKIHPFLDGNGRVGRLLMQMVLREGHYDMKGLLSIEEYLDANREVYYQSLENNEKNVTNYVECMLEAIADAAQKAKKLVLEKKNITKEDFLLPRRAEILSIIRDHRLVNFDQIRRRFMAVNERTLRYDLKKLAQEGFIRKRGATKGVYYEANGPQRKF